jgi:hypothetical protein
MVKLSLPGIGPMIRFKGKFNMRQFSFRLACVGLVGSLILAGCGGGSPSSGGSAAVCELPLAYANGGSSGNRIDAVTQTINRQFNPCPIQRVQTLTVGVCVDHSQINELSAQLFLPDGTAQNLNIQNANSAGTCLISGQLLQTTLTSNNLQSLRSLSGNWSVRVSDNNQVSITPIGSLVGWSLRAEGLQ